MLAVELSTAIVSGSVNSVLGATFYERIPENLRARVLGVIRASAWVGIPFGALGAGAVTQAYGVTPGTVVVRSRVLPDHAGAVRLPILARDAPAGSSFGVGVGLSAPAAGFGAAAPGSDC